MAARIIIALGALLVMAIGSVSVFTDRAERMADELSTKAQAALARQDLAMVEADFSSGTGSPSRQRSGQALGASEPEGGGVWAF